mgnify:CR=1 FL=1
MRLFRPNRWVMSAAFAGLLLALGVASFVLTRELRETPAAEAQQAQDGENGEDRQLGQKLYADVREFVPDTSEPVEYPGQEQTEQHGAAQSQQCREAKSGRAETQDIRHGKQNTDQERSLDDFPHHNDDAIDQHGLISRSACQGRFWG